MRVLKTNFTGNPNVGLYGYCNDSYCLLGREVPARKAKQVGRVLDVPVHQVTICGTSLIGVFVTGNSQMLLVPEIAFDYELKQLDKLKIDYTIIRSKSTALGNNLLCNDKGCLANPDFSADQKKRIRQALGVALKPGKIAGLGTVGSLAVLNSKGCIVHRDITRAEARYIEDLLGLRCTPSTINMGSPYIRSGVLCNDKGFIVGDASGGPEITNIEQELGFLEPKKRKRR
jgi:translation initiation factor 6